MNIEKLIQHHYTEYSYTTNRKVNSGNTIDILVKTPFNIITITTYINGQLHETVGKALHVSRELSMEYDEPVMAVVAVPEGTNKILTDYVRYIEVSDELN